MRDSFPEFLARTPQWDWHDDDDDQQSGECAFAEVEALVRRPHPVVRSELASLATRVLACEERTTDLEDKLTAAGLAEVERNALFIRLTTRVRQEAAKIAGVTNAYVSPVEPSFVLTGPQWTEALSEAGAELATQLQRELNPELTVFLDGGFERDRDPDSDGPEGWFRVYP